MKKYFKICILALTFLYILFLLPKNIETYLKKVGVMCTVEQNNLFKKIAGKSIKINDKMIIAFNFKEKNYTGFSEDKHLFEKEDLERDLKDGNVIFYEYKDFDNDEILNPVDCHTSQLPPVSYIVFENSKKERFFMNHFRFRALNYTIPKK